MLQDLFAAALAIDRALTYAAPEGATQIAAARDVVGRAIEALREVVKP